MIEMGQVLLHKSNKIGLPVLYQYFLGAGERQLCLTLSMYIYWGMSTSVCTEGLNYLYVGQEWWMGCAVFSLSEDLTDVPGELYWSIRFLMEYVFAN
jgi:hypothetical protein